jgi:hypothetical protein
MSTLGLFTDAIAALASISRTSVQNALRGKNPTATDTRVYSLDRNAAVEPALSSRRQRDEGEALCLLSTEREPSANKE